MNALDRQIIVRCLENLDLKLLSCHCRVEENEYIVRGYIPFIVKVCLVKNRQDVKRDMIQNSLITLHEFYKISSSFYNRRNRSI